MPNGLINVLLALKPAQRKKIFMSDFMKNLSSYNLFNNLLPGVVFCVIASELFPISLVQNDLVTGIFFYYFIGLIIGRVGSVVIEPTLKKVGFLNFSEYSDFIDASKSDVKLEVLSETNNMYRSVFSMSLALVAVALHFGLTAQIEGFKSYSTYIYIIGLTALFAWSYRKQTAYIKTRVQNTLRKEAE